MNYGIFSKSRGSGRWGACCPRGSPLSPGLRRMVGVWERWVTHSEKGDELSLRTWLASEGHSQGGAGQTTVPPHPGLVHGWEGMQGYAGARCKRGARQEGGMPRADPVTRPVASDPRLHISGGGGQRGGVELCAPSHWGQG